MKIPIKEKRRENAHEESKENVLFMWKRASECRYVKVHIIKMKSFHLLFLLLFSALKAENFSTTFVTLIPTTVD